MDIEKFEEAGYCYVPVEWNLHAGEFYTVCYSVEENDGEVSLAVTEPGNTPLQEIEQVILNGEKIDGQPVVILSYWNRPVVKRRLIFLTLTWIGVLTGVMATGCTALLKIKNSRLPKN